jgi:carbon-monoxide dehydrogenase medium subunit
VANIRIRNMATIAGNLAHADYQSDPPTALVALNASVELTSNRGSRSVKLADFLLGPYETGLEPGELISAVLVPPPEDTAKGTYLKFTTRSSEDRPCAGVAATTRWLNGVCEEARVVVGAVSPTPVLVRGDHFLQGKRFTSEWIEEIADNAGNAVDPIDDLRGTATYKRRLVKVLVQRALLACMA